MILGPETSRSLADTVLVVHVAVVVFIVGGLLVVLLGHALRWQGVDDPWFRLAHLVAIGVVVAESLTAFVCPLTTLEMWLRSRAGGTRYDGGFIEHWLHRLLFFDAPPWIFTTGYCAFGAMVLGTWWYWPPRSTRGRDSR